MKFTFDGATYDYLEVTRLSWMDWDTLENLTGYTSTEMQADPKVRGKALVSAARFWMSIHKGGGKVTWEDYAKTLDGDTVLIPDEREPVTPPGAADPLDDSSSEVSDANTSGSSPSTSESDPGNGTG